MIPRLHVAGDYQSGDTLELSPDQAFYLAQVLRLSVDAPLQLFDGAGRRFAARLLNVRKQRAQVHVAEALAANRLGPVRLTLIQSLSAAEKMDWTIEKATELGVARIVPIVTRRSKIKLDAERGQRRLEHWQRLISAACMQSERDQVVELASIGSLDTLPDLISTIPHRLVLAPPQIGRITPRLSEWQPAGDHLEDRDDEPGELSIAILVGPESGLDNEEIDQACRLGFAPVSLGPRVLRTETAGLAALAALQVRFGDM